MKESKIGLIAAMAAVTMNNAFAATNATDKLDVKVGADVRLRYDVTQGLPNTNHGDDPHSEY